MQGGLPHVQRPWLTGWSHFSSDRPGLCLETLGILHPAFLGICSAEVERPSVLWNCSRAQPLSVGLLHCKGQLHHTAMLSCGNYRYAGDRNLKNVWDTKIGRQWELWQSCVYYLTFRNHANKNRKYFLKNATLKIKRQHHCPLLSGWHRHM